MESVLEKGMVITIGGPCGTGKGTVSKIIAYLLGFELLSAGEIFADIAEEKGVTVERLGELAKEDPTIDEMVDEKMKKFCRAPHRIGEGHIAWHSAENSVKILLICEFNERMSRTQKRDGYDTFEEARDETLLREKVASERYRDLYGISGMYDLDPHYDFEVDTTKATPEEVAKAIIDFLKLKGMYYPLRKH